MPVFGLDVKCLTSDQVVRCAPVFHNAIQPALTANARLHCPTWSRHKCLAAELLVEVYLGLEELKSEVLECAIDFLFGGHHSTISRAFTIRGCTYQDAVPFRTSGMYVEVL